MSLWPSHTLSETFTSFGPPPAFPLLSEKRESTTVVPTFYLLLVYGLKESPPEGKRGRGW